MNTHNSSYEQVFLYSKGIAYLVLDTNGVFGLSLFLLKLKTETENIVAK